MRIISIFSKLAETELWSDLVLVAVSKNTVIKLIWAEFFYTQFFTVETKSADWKQEIIRTKERSSPRWISVGMLLWYRYPHARAAISHLQD
jgi:hypothetical protein